MKENLPSLFCFLTTKLKNFLSAKIGHHQYTQYPFPSICLSYLPQNISLTDYSSGHSDKIKTIIIELDDGELLFGSYHLIKNW